MGEGKKNNENRDFPDKRISDEFGRTCGFHGKPIFRSGSVDHGSEGIKWRRKNGETNKMIRHLPRVHRYTSDTNHKGCSGG